MDRLEPIQRLILVTIVAVDVPTSKYTGSLHKSHSELMGQQVAPTKSGTTCFVFAGVELDVDKHTLYVDGRLVRCSPKAFELLAQLCLVSNRLQTRDELIAALWPGGQIVSDESLTQVVFRARAALGRYGRVLSTVRGVGLRIDVPIVQRKVPTEPNQSTAKGSALDTDPGEISTNEDISFDAVEPLPRDVATETASCTAEPTTRRRTGTSLRAGMIVSMVAILLAVGIAFTLKSDVTPSTSIDDGYGLFETDLHADDPRTATWIRDALLHDAHGERGRGEALLRAVHQADASTPVPALFLALWADGDGRFADASSWLTLAQERSIAYQDVYTKLLHGYVAAELSHDSAAVIHQAGALLDVRPQAWQMRLARAHLMIASNLRTAALRELQQIKVTALGDRKLEMVIADRASLGDIDGAQYRRSQESSATRLANSAISLAIISSGVSHPRV